ncbi:MAG: aminopeptidase P family protein [Acidobacteria bacterium]|nr:aminopeptidase P family protein [Acidobacteriota bacterium]
MDRIFQEIPEALRQAGVDGWLFYDHHRRDPLAYRVLGFEPAQQVTRRWYYLVRSDGSVEGLVHRIESHVLDPLPGPKAGYAGWELQKSELARMLGGLKRVAMQYSPLNAIPYVSMVDAGTVELVRSLGVEVVSSADLVQHFEARWTAEQFEMHLEAGRRVDRTRADAFRHAGEALAAGRRLTEFELQGFILDRFVERGLVTDHGPIVAVNANASNPHYGPERDWCSVIAPGDVLLLDMWAKLDRPRAVYYDITWMGYCGAVPRPEVERVFGVARAARMAGVEKACSGGVVHGFEVDDATRGVIAGAGLGEYFFHRTGHSIGEEVHGTGVNMDNLETRDSRRIVPGLCFSIEPGIYLPEFGVRSEVNVFMGADGGRVTGEEQERLVLV